ncbi:hypothetical protein [uncultured Thiodictyon sp.]|uniref:hypothetical protein n=1 Tax=uncultured Thiodictyon sp. TaxID=1846217 RepID=UPI0025EB598E|nr:hypothetical protein [uncultured Thiodictyon sp.]
MRSHQPPTRPRSHLDIFNIALAGLLFWTGLALSSTAAVGAPTGERLEIADAAGKPVLVLTRDADQVAVADGAGNPLLLGARKAPGRTDYRLPDGTPFARAKGDPDVFKLTAPDGHLLRKVKRDEDRIKIADNAENAGAAVLRRRGADKWELEIDKDAAGKVKDYPDGAGTGLKVKDRAGETRYRLANTALTPVPLVLLIPDLPAGEARAVMAEGWLRGW